MRVVGSAHRRAAAQTCGWPARGNDETTTRTTVPGDHPRFGCRQRVHRRSSSPVNVLQQGGRAADGRTEAGGNGPGLPGVFRASICESNCALRETMTTGQRIVNRLATIRRNDGRIVPVSISTALLRDRQQPNPRRRGVGARRIGQGAPRHELSDRQGIGDLIGRSPAMQRLVETLPVVAASVATVLVEGESGTGKELVARALHNLSPRRDAPFVAVNCGAIPDTLVESELFGHRAGAFTDARRDRQGRFELASTGSHPPGRGRAPVSVGPDQTASRAPGTPGGVVGRRPTDAGGREGHSRHERSAFGPGRDGRVRRRISFIASASSPSLRIRLSGSGGRIFRFWSSGCWRVWWRCTARRSRA